MYILCISVADRQTRIVERGDYSRGLPRMDCSETMLVASAGPALQHGLFSGSSVDWESASSDVLKLLWDGDLDAFTRIEV